MSTRLQYLKKFELVQLAEKLDLKFPVKLKKSALIDIIETHLRGLKSPLDPVEYPELEEYYNESTEDEKYEETEEESDGDSLSVLGNCKWFSKLRFDTIRPCNAKFSFKFHEFVSDVQNNIVETNETIQDTLSTIPAIGTIFLFLELYFYIVKPFFHFNLKDRPYYVSTTLSRSQFAFLVMFWFNLSFAIPALIGYYINFIRYDLPSVEIDPLVFHVAKSLISIAICNYWKHNFVQEATYAAKETLGTAKLSEIIGHELAFAQLQWRLNLQQWPLVFGITGVFICLYVL